MLEALEAAGVDLMSDCRKGECGLCQVDVLELTGTIDHRDVFYSQRQQHAAATMCCCVSRVTAAKNPDRSGSAPSDYGRAVLSIEVS